MSFPFSPDASLLDSFFTLKTTVTTILSCLQSVVGGYTSGNFTFRERTKWPFGYLLPTACSGTFWSPHFGLLGGSDWEMWIGGRPTPRSRRSRLAGKKQLETEPETFTPPRGVLLNMGCVSWGICNLHPNQFSRPGASPVDHSVRHTSLPGRWFLSVQPQSFPCADVGPTLGQVLGLWVWQQFSSLAKSHISDFLTQQFSNLTIWQSSSNSHLIER